MRLKQDKTIHSDHDIEEGPIEKAGSECSVSSHQSSVPNRTLVLSTWSITAFILILGCAVSGAFLGIGISSAIRDQDEQFHVNAVDLVKKIQSAWDDYINAAAMIHGRCRGRNFTRQDFRELYEYIVGGGLDFQAAQFDPNVTNSERAAYEEEARKYYAEHYPYIDYQGFVGFNYENSTKLEPRVQADYYFPIHFMEPIPGNIAAIDLDYYASGSRKRTVMACMDSGKPALTDRLRLVQETEEVAYGVVLMHPGYNLTITEQERWPRDLASIVVRIPDLLRRATQIQSEASEIYLYDQSDSLGETLFLGAVRVTPALDKQQARLTFLSEVTLKDLYKGGQHYYQENIVVTNKIWTVSVRPSDDSFNAKYGVVLVGGIIIFLAALALAVWVNQNTRKVAKINRLKAEAETERAALIVENAQQAAKAERELNDFIAHEVRNPVAAAMSACSFVKIAVNKRPPLADEESITTTKGDVDIIENALRFVNDLLRNMLDMHRATNKQLKVAVVPTDILHDVLEPVQSMLVQREGKVRVEVNCRPCLFAMSDRLRLKQVVMNLGRNAQKFVDAGFIRLSAREIDDQVEISVEDSGPGIPTEKRKLLFKKYQESLDVLSQGTGIGLFLCKNLVELMDGQIWLDEEYDSGLPGRPGARIVVRLSEPPIDFSIDHLDKYGKDGESGDTDPATLSDEDGALALSLSQELPENLSVLFVDDDPVLRKLFSRTVRTVSPGWSIREASNGETALRLTESDHFDLIFMDMYMASVDKQLLGTETVEVLRSKGIKCRICGLSANDKEAEFIQAGADVFTFKPFPCEPVALRQELIRILFSKDNSDET